MAYSAKAPCPPEHHLNGNKVLYAKMAPSAAKKPSARHIPQVTAFPVFSPREAANSNSVADARTDLGRTRARQRLLPQPARLVRRQPPRRRPGGRRLLVERRSVVVIGRRLIYIAFKVRSTLSMVPFQLVSFLHFFRTSTSLLLKVFLNFLVIVRD